MKTLPRGTCPTCGKRGLGQYHATKYVVTRTCRYCREVADVTRTTDMRSPNYDYRAAAALRREARKDYWKYIEASKRQYPYGSLST